MRCGRPLEEENGQYCAGCEGKEHAFVQGRAVFLYEKSLRESIHRMKYQGRRIYLPFYAAAMEAGGGAFLRRLQPAALIPVPIHARRRAERGFDQCLLLAELLGQWTGIPVRADLLQRRRYTRPQKGLGPEGRRANLAGAFAAKTDSRIHGAVVLIDDIYTTGATIDACARALREAGMDQVYFLALSIAGH